MAKNCRESYDEKDNRVPCLLEYICPGGKAMNRSQSSLKAFISEANHTDPAKRTYFVKYLSYVNEINRTNLSPKQMKIRKNNNR